MSATWSEQEHDDLLEYQQTLNKLIREGLMSRAAGLLAMQHAMGHAKKHRHEELEDYESSSSPGPVDLDWLFSQTEFDRYAAYLFWLYEYFGTWDRAGAYLGVSGQALMKKFKRRV